MSLRRLVAALAVVGLAGCTAGGSDVPPREGWLRATAHLLDQPIVFQGETVTLQLPAYEADDTYTMALAVTALGSRAPAAIAEVGRDRVVARLRDPVAEGRLEDTVGGVLYTATELARADQTAPVLAAAEREALREIVDSALRGEPGRRHDYVDAYVLVELATALDHRVADAQALARQTVAGAPDAHCVLGEDPFAFLIPLATPGVVGLCPDGALEEGWDTLAADLTARLAEPAPLDAAPCMVQHGLTESWHRHWPDDPARTRTVRSTLDTFQDRLADDEVYDLVACLSGLQRAAALAGVELTLPARARAYLESVLRNGAQPVLVTLAARSAAELVATGRMVGAEVAVPAEFLAARTPADELALRTARGDTWQSGVAELVDRVAAAAPGPDETRVLVEALVLAGEQACPSSGGLAVAQELVADRGAGRPAGLLFVSTAQAIRVLETCGRDIRAGVRQSLLAEATGVFDAAEPEPDLMQGWAAAAVLCALDPGALPDVEDRWRSYHGIAAEIGGADGGDGKLSVHLTYHLAGLVVGSADACAGTGLLGWQP